MPDSVEFFTLVLLFVMVLTIMISSVRGEKIFDTIGPIGARWSLPIKLVVFVILHAISALTWTLFWVWFDSPSLWVGVFLGYYVLVFGGQAWAKHLTTKKPNDGWDSF